MKIDHIGIAVENLQKALDIYSGTLGFEVRAVHHLVDDGIKIAVITSDGTVLELIEPIGNASPVARFLKSRGQGIHHLCFAVSRFDETVSRFKSQGLRPVGQIRTGVEGRRVIFFHPKDTMGVLIEISEGDD